jgi:hypothetical protein
MRNEPLAEQPQADEKGPAHIAPGLMSHETSYRLIFVNLYSSPTDTAALMSNCETLAP